MKSHTDLPQSKKLAEILPLESADMYYFLDPTPAGNIYHLTVQRVDVGIKNLPHYDEGDIPAWSLSALLELIPPYLGKFNDGIDFGFSKSMNGKWYSAYYIQLDNSGLATFTKTVTGDTAIDAAFEMVCWLKENGKI